MTKWTGLAGILSVALMMSPVAAFAGAWTLKAGEGLVIVGAVTMQARSVFDKGHQLQRIPVYSKTDVQALIEYGAADWLTLIVAPSLQHVDIAAPVNAQRDGLGYTSLGGRVRLWSNESWVVSGQAVLRIPGTTDLANPAALSFTDPEFDLRAMVGYSFKAGAWPAFLDFAVAQRFRDGGPPDEFRADFAIGVRPHERWLVLVQLFNVVSEGAGTLGFFRSYEYHKFQASVAYALTPALSLQVGGYTTYWARNALQENGLMLGATYKF